MTWNQPPNPSHSTGVQLAMGMRRSLEDGTSLIGPFVKLRDADAFHLTCAANPDFVILDAEHSQLSEGQLRELCALGRLLGMATIVRIPRFDSDLVNRLLESGAAGIQLSSVESGEMAADLATSMAYPPHGKRSLSLGHAEAGYGLVTRDAYLASQAGRALCIVQIETVQGVESLEAVCEAKPDIVFVGTSDLRLQCDAHGLDYDATLAQVFGTVTDHRLLFGGFGSSARAVEDLIAAGATYIAYSSDLSFYGAAIRNEIGIVNPKRNT